MPLRVTSRYIKDSDASHLCKCGDEDSIVIEGFGRLFGTKSLSFTFSNLIIHSYFFRTYFASLQSFPSCYMVFQVKRSLLSSSSIELEVSVQKDDNQRIMQILEIRENISYFCTMLIPVDYN